MNDSTSWQETQRKLLQDIETFARSEPNFAAAETPEKTKPRTSLPPVAAPTAPPKPQAAPAPAAPSAPPPAAAGGSLLEKLKREAQAKQLTESQTFSLHVQKKHFISETLQATFQYLRELCEQLNILKPAYPLGYSLAGLASLDGLVWQEGRADFRLVPDSSENRLLEQVTLRFRLASGQQLRVERENPAHELFRAALIDANIAYKEEEFRNQRNHIERVAFSFPAEVKAGLAFAADYQAGDIRLRLRNIRRFGAADYRLPFEALDHAAHEELAHLVLGEESRIEKMFQRVA